MPNLAIVSLAAILAAIAIGFIKKTNVGILMIGFAFIISKFYGISNKQLLAGFNASLFVTMMGVTYLFSILIKNKTLEILGQKIVGLVRIKKALPIAIYFVGFVLTAMGPGSIPVLAIMPVIAIPIAFSAGCSPMMLSIIGECGAFGGRMTKITPEGLLTIRLMEEQGITSGIMPVWACLFLTSIVLSVVCYIYYKGWKMEESGEGRRNETAGKFNRDQIISLIGLAALIVGAVAFSWNVGLTAFTIGMILSAIGVADEGACIKAIPWSVLILVSGVGILMNVVLESGGIDLLSNSLTAVMSQRTAAAIMDATACFMSFFSSGLGVVFPTLMPTCGPVAANFGGAVNPSLLVAMVAVGGTVSGLSPVSTTGALIMSGIAADEESDEKYDSSKMFVELFGWAFAALGISFLMAILGVYNLLV